MFQFFRGLTIIFRNIITKGSYSIIILIIIFISCETTTEKKKLLSDPYWNDLARFLAGMPLSETSAFYPKTQSWAYERHVKMMDDMWFSIKTEALDLVIPWREKNMPGVYKRNMVFYPLSGPDFVNLYAMFPDSEYYLMVALEESGDIPEPLKLSDAKLNSGLRSIARVMYNYGMFNYFLSRAMKTETCNVNLTGTTPILMIFLARMGLKLVKIEVVGIDWYGKVMKLDKYGYINGMEPYFKGTRFVFLAPGDNTPRTLLYLSMRLSNDSISMDTPSGKFLNTMKDAKIMMKSAVYLLHMKNFTSIKDFLLEKSVMVVQDDSGIPFKSFNNDWKVKPFGVYEPPYVLKGCYIITQYDLLKLYRQGAPMLPFNFGYGSLRGKHKSNLIICVKKNEEDTG